MGDRCNHFFVPVWGTVECGFPSPAEGYQERRVDLHELLVPRPTSTFFFTVEGDALLDEGIPSESILVVDRAATPAPRDLVVLDRNGERLVTRLRRHEGQSCRVWGRVTAVVTRY